MNKQNTVLKFGGSSVSSPEMINQALCITKKAYESHQVSVVVSALGGTTNTLIDLAKKAKNGDFSIKADFDLILERHKTQFKTVSDLDFSEELGDVFQELWDSLEKISASKTLSNKDLDLIMSFGERFSVRMFCAGLNHIGIPAVYRETQHLVRTDSTFGDAVVELEFSANRLKNAVDLVEGVVVFTGFIASNEKGEITTLGRSGSDFTGGLVGYSIDADLVEIWTDVDGVYTTDPNLVKNAIIIPELSYHFMEIMADNGAKVLHPRTVRPLQLKEIPIVIKNTFNPSAPGTLVTVHQDDAQQAITTVGLTKNQAFISDSELSKIKKSFTERHFTFFEQKSIQIQSHKGVTGFVISEKDDFFDEFIQFLEQINGNSLKPSSQITLLTTHHFKTNQLDSVLAELENNGVPILGFLFENKAQFSIFVEAKFQQKTLEMVHNLMCLKVLSLGLANRI